MTGVIVSHLTSRANSLTLSLFFAKSTEEMTEKGREFQSVLSQRDRDSSLTYKTLPNQCASLEKEEELCTCCNADPGSRPDRGSLETTFFNYQVCKGFSVADNLGRSVR